MRRLVIPLASLAALALAVGLSSPAAGRVYHQPEPTATTEVPSETPIVDPEPQPVPLYLPWTGLRHDRTLPPPLTAIARGYVAALTPNGREACRPATHVLLERPEGTAGNVAVAVLVQGLPDPNLTLDLYVAEYVEVTGTDALSPGECRPVTARLMSVRGLRVIPQPPGR